MIRDRHQAFREKLLSVEDAMLLAASLDGEPLEDKITKGEATDDRLVETSFAPDFAS